MNFRLLAVALVGLLAGGAVAITVLPETRRHLPSLPSTGEALVGGPFELVDHTGKTVTDKDFRGRFMLVYFGFTFCPDVCPSGLQVISEALDRVGPKAERIVPLFISVDPERDTPAQLAQYVQSFHPRLVGLTGTPEQIEVALKAYRSTAKRVNDDKSTAGYTFDHTALMFLMDPKGKYVAHFTHATPVERMVERLQKAL